MIAKINDFDKNSKVRIYNLIVLNGEALLRAHFLAFYEGYTPGQPYTNFFNAISNQIDPLLAYLLNDEVTASLNNRGPLSDLLSETKKEHYKDEDYKRYDYGYNHLFELFHDKTDFIIGSKFLDFTVSTYSAFELYIGHIYEHLIQTTPRSNKKECLLVKLIEKYSNEKDEKIRVDLLNKIKNLNFYLSGKEKIEYVISKCSIDKNIKKEWMIFLKNYGARRNTIHNLGIHNGESVSDSIDGIETTLNKGEPSTTSNWNSSIFACRKLMEIYSDIYSNIYKMRII
jgi:hypothetical protein